MTQNTPERKGKHGGIGLQSELGKVKAPTKEPERPSCLIRPS